METETEPEMEPEAGSEAGTESEMETGTEAETETKGETEVEPEVKMDAEPETEIEDEIAAETETEAEPERELEAKTEAETETKGETEAESEAKMDVEMEPENELKSEIKAESETEIEDEPETQIEAESEAKIELEIKPEAEPEVEPKIKKLQSPVNFAKYAALVEDIDPIKVNGELTSVSGLILESSGPLTAIGSVCSIFSKDGSTAEIEAEVVGIKEDKILLMPLAENRGISKGMIVKVKSQSPVVNLSNELLGRVINGSSEFIDGKPYAPVDEVEYPLYRDPLNPLERGFITESLDVGVRSINSLMTIGRGQRMGIMAGSGVGKSVLLGMMAKNTAADVNVIALIGERGREVREFIHDNLGEEGLKKSVVIVATSDQPPLVRIRATYLAITIAEFFRDQGKDVLLTMDSVTRYAMAQREISLFLGEPPTSKGYTPSVFTNIPKILERLGNVEGKGSITGIFTVLIEGDDINDPIGDCVRSVVDGHIFLSRKIAERGLYPSIDILNSVSRSMVNVVSDEHLKQSMQIKEMVSVYQDSEDLINIGAYVAGTNPKIDKSITMHEPIQEFVRQGINDRYELNESIMQLQQLMR